MVSTAMQGGCTCENASLLRVGTGNVEFAALFAPRPLGMTAANDRTKAMPSKGFPELQRHYALMGAPQNVEPNVLDLRDPSFLPAATKYGDVPGLLALGRTPVRLLGNGETLATEAAAAQRLTADPSLITVEKEGAEATRDVLRWLIED